MCFFPYITAGPIAWAREFLPQLVSPRDPRRIDTARAFFLIFAGLAKKMLLADYLATHLVNGVFTSPGHYTSLEVLFGIIGYSVQIYSDFSAYSDIASGISLLLGFQLSDNFDAPYTAVSVQDFWRRWHMALSRWLRDYRYIPLGGNRKGQTRRLQQVRDGDGTHLSYAGGMRLARVVLAAIKADWLPKKKSGAVSGSPSPSPRVSAKASPAP